MLGSLRLEGEVAELVECTGFENQQEGNLFGSSNLPLSRNTGEEVAKATQSRNRQYVLVRTQTRKFFLEIPPAIWAVPPKIKSRASKAPTTQIRKMELLCSFP